jgi:hypothetical protein
MDYQTIKEANADATQNAWHYIIGAISFHVVEGKPVAPDTLQDILLRAEEFGNGARVRQGVEAQLDVQRCIDGMRAQLSVA